MFSILRHEAQKEFGEKNGMLQKLRAHVVAWHFEKLLADRSCATMYP